MKIGIEVQRLFRKKKYGIETSSLELIKKLTEIGSANEFVVFARDDEDRSCLRASPNIKIRTIAGNYFADFEQIFLPIAARNERVDILHCTGNTAPYFSPVPIIQTLHDVIFMDAIPEKDTLYQRFGNRYRRSIVPLITPRSEVVITVSQYEKARIVNRLGIPEQKIHVIYNGINEKRFFPQPVISHHSVMAKYNLPQDFILFLGNSSYRKNSIGVIEAYVAYASESVDPLPLVAPGLDEKFVASRLKQLQYPFDRQQIITPGYIAEDDLACVYGMSKIFLFPSLSEGFGMPVIEAMACGAPVITSNVSCMPEIAGNAAILVDPNRAPDIANGLLSLSRNEGLRARKIQDGLSNVKRFSWNQSAEKVLQIYETVYERAKDHAKRPAVLQKQVSISRD